MNPLNCEQCRKPFTSNHHRILCKECKRKNAIEWWRTNWKWVAGTACIAGISIIIASVMDSDNTDAPTVSEPKDNNDPLEIPIPAPTSGSKYWNSITQNWEKDGKPYTYRVTYTDSRTGEVCILDYGDIDNGYEDYLYYDRQWYTRNTTWDHIAPDEL